MSGDLVLVVRRVIRASPTRLFDAWTQPELLRQWWGPRPVTCVDADVDLRVGGAYRIANGMPDGSVLWITGAFEVVEPPRKLVYTWCVETVAERSRVTVRFEPRDAGTEVIIVHEKIASEAARTSHEQGWLGCLDGLDRVVPTQ